MKRREKETIGLLAVLLLSIVSVSLVSSDVGHDQQSTQTAMIEEHHMLHNFDSDQEFGQHIREHNDMFSGMMNPGVHHKGYSLFIRG